MLARGNTLTGATLFSGIGAPEVAMPHWRWPWHAEIERFQSAVMARRHPRSINLGDVTAHDFTARAAGIAKPNVLVFGSPCQDWSVAGKRLGLDGARGNTALIALGIVDRLKPDWFVFENVPGLLSSWSGAEEGPVEAGAEWETQENSDFATFLGCVDELRYSLAWGVLDAQYFGVAQRRRRVLAVGHLGDWRAPAAILFEPESLCGHSAPRRETGERVAATLTASPGGVSQKDDIAGRVVAFNNTGQGWRNDSDVASPIRTPEGSGSLEATVIAFSSKDYGGDAVCDIAPTLRCGNHPAVAITLRGRTGGATAEIGGDISNALRASQGGGDKAHILLSDAIRRLTPRECERLQGFEDDYTLISYRGKPAADGPRYHALGNSMAVPVMRWILSRIEAVEGISHAT